MKVDLHSHTAEHSGCSDVPAVEMVRAARDRGLDGLVISDHHYHMTDADRRALEAAVPGIRLFRGVEIGLGGSGGPGSVWEDIVVVSDVPVPCGSNIPDGAIGHFADFVQRSGALTILAHPFRFHAGIAFDLDRFVPDAVELASLNTSSSNHDRIVSLARHNRMNLVAASDAHDTNGAAIFCIDVDDEVTNERELAGAIRRGAFTLAAHEPTLQWREKWITPIEDLARRVLARGGDREMFLALGGQYAGFFDCVAAGGSLLPNRRAVGLRNPDAPPPPSAG